MLETKFHTHTEPQATLDNVVNHFHGTADETILKQIPKRMQGQRKVLETLQHVKSEQA
jgi:hypothetical protein